METKPYSLQAPEGIAKEYGGNKQKIAAAVQMGMVDPTAALLAGMFIDRMRGAQSLEQGPTQTLAQQVFAPPQMPGASGLGAINSQPHPQAAAAMNPQPQQAPPPPPPGMASGGLAALENGAFNEDSFAGGGIVAFSKGGSEDRRKKDWVANLIHGRGVLGSAKAEPESLAASLDAVLYGQGYLSPEKRKAEVLRDIALSRGLEPPPEPNMLSPEQPNAQPPQFDVAPTEPGLGGTAVARASSNARTRTKGSATSEDAAPPTEPRKSIADLMTENQKLLGPAVMPETLTKEDMAARKREDLWTTLAQIGFGTAAGTSQHALENVGKGAAAAMPGMQEALKNRRADEKDARKEQFAALQAERGIKGQMLKASVDQFMEMSKMDQERELRVMADNTSRRGQDINREVGMAQVNRESASERLVDMVASAMRPDATPEQKRRGEAAQFALGKYSGDVGGAEISNKASDNVQNRIKNDTNLQRKLRKLAQEDAKNRTSKYDEQIEIWEAAERKKLGAGALSGPVNKFGGGTSKRMRFDADGNPV